MSTLKLNKDFTKSDSPKQLIYAYAKYNGSDSETIKQTIAEDTIGTLNGCIFTIDFENALCRDMYNSRTDLTDAIIAGKLRRTGSYYKTLTEGLNKLAKASGSLASYKVCRNERQNQGNRTKTAVKHGLQYIRSNMANYGKNVDCIITDDQGAYSTVGAGYMADGRSNSDYALFDETPILSVQRWLRSIGFKTGGTTRLWYRDNNSFDVIENFKENALQFAKGLKFLKAQEGSKHTKESKAIKGSITEA